MKNAAAVFGFFILISALGFKISRESGYREVSDTFRSHPAPLLLFNPATTPFLLSQSHKSETQVVESYTGPKAEQLVKFAGNLLGTRYVFGGNEPTGFDCSGFTNYVYGKFGYNVPHGSVNQALAGKQITLQEVKSGDLLIFTGTSPEVREPGHAGIVISKKGEPIRFIHASSNGGVKISEVEGTRYAVRLLQVRRIL